MPALDDSGRCAGHHLDRARILSERGAAGIAKRNASRQAARDTTAAKLGLRTDDEQLAALETALRSLMRAKLDAAKVATATAALVKVAREIIHGGLEQQADRLSRLLEEHPELAKRLRVVE